MATTKINFKRGNGYYDVTSGQATTTLAQFANGEGTLSNCEPWVHTGTKQLWVDNVCINPHLIALDNSLAIQLNTLTAQQGAQILFNVRISADNNNALSLRNDGLYSTDTHYLAKNIIANTSTSTTHSTTSLTNGSVFLNLLENGVSNSGYGIVGTGVCTVTWNPTSNQIEIYTPNQAQGDIQLGRLVKDQIGTTGWYKVGGFYTGSETTTLKWGLHHEPQSANNVGSMIEFRQSPNSISGITTADRQIEMRITVIDGGTF